MISLRDVSFSYGAQRALDHVSLDIEKGELVAIIGPNASGKTTLAMAMNALILPQEGDCLVDGVSTKDDPMFAHRTVGMVFQDPESQAVSRHVWDDVAFGPMNLGLSEEEVAKRARSALETAGLGDKAKILVSCLSGGQKQLLAIAGVLAMQPSYVILDEPTALLDGTGCRMVRKAIADLKKNDTGIILVTHDMEEALLADRIIALKDGRILANMPPAALFSDAALMEGIGIRPPYTYELSKYAGFIPLEVTRECR